MAMWTIIHSYSFLFRLTASTVVLVAFSDAPAPRSLNRRDKLSEQIGFLA